MMLSEVYKSVQGEGPRTGAPTIFVRFAGCNLRCPGWPCDTQHAIDPAKYRSEWAKVGSEELVQRIVETDKLNGTGDLPYAPSSISFTGGEPFLQSGEELHVVIRDLIDAGYQTFEFWTNGTLLWPEWHTEHAYKILDWKLPGSGEVFNEKVDKTRRDQMHELGAGDAVKFVIKDRNDFEQAYETWDEYQGRTKLASRFQPDFYYGVVWGALENKELVEWVLDEGLPWKLNVQMHNYIWDRNERGI